MANTQQTQAFYALTLEQPSAVTSAFACNALSQSNEQHILEARGQRLLLHAVRSVAGPSSDRTLVTLAEQDMFSIIRGVAAFRVPGTPVDQLIVASDSGRISLLEFDSEKRSFKQIARETFGKSGVRRTIPGQYVACDPRGRCVMLASPEKNKVIYFLNRDTEGNIVISSPHEANQWANICFELVALDRGWEQPVFGSLESDYSEFEQDPTGEIYARREKSLAYYTVDLGLNHAVKTWSDPVDSTTNKLFAVPGGDDGPSGVLVCAEDRIYYRHDKAKPHMVPIPRRKGPTEDSTRKRHIICGCLHLGKSRLQSFFLLQTEDGDVFKLQTIMKVDEHGRSTAEIDHISIKYYDTFPVARTILLHKKGYLYVATENGPGQLYHINDLADDPDFEPENAFTSENFRPHHNDPYEPIYFQPRERTYTEVTSTLPGLHPLLRCKVDNLFPEDAPQIYALQGSGNRSQLKTIRHGLEIDEHYSNSLGQTTYDNLFAFKHRRSDVSHQYLLVSTNFGDSTVICSIGDSVEQLFDSGFLENRATILAQLMGESTLVQVHARGVHSIKQDGSTTDWEAPRHRTIGVAAANDHQLMLGLSSSEIVYFYTDVHGDLVTLEDRPEQGSKITALALAPTPHGRLQAKYAVIGCEDCTIRVISLDTDSPLQHMSMQALSAIPSSIVVVEMFDPNSNSNINIVHIGLQSGLYLRALIDETSGEFFDVRTKFLGTKPPRFFPIEVQDQNCVLACSTRPWIIYNHPQTGQLTTTPLICPRFEAVQTFISPETKALCAISEAGLTIFTIPSLNGRLAYNSVELSYTPRGMTRHPDVPFWYIVQSDGNTLSKATRDGLRSDVIDTTSNGVENGEADVLELEKHLGLPHGDRHWASCIQVVDPVFQKAVISTIELQENEAALCCTCIAFESQKWETYLAVGTGQHMNPSTRDISAGYVHIYRILEDGRKLSLVHKTHFDTPVYALTPFRGRLAIGVKNELFIYDMGTSRLLRKSRGVVGPRMIVTLDTQGNRIVCGDVSGGMTYVVYKPKHNRMIPFVDDTVNRWTTAACMVDYETSAGGDKFGNLWLVRCPPVPSREADEDGTGGYIMNERSYLNGAPYRLELRAHYFCQDVPTSVQRTALVAGGQEVLFWSGLQGTLGMLAPFVSREDVELFTSLEREMRHERVSPSLVGRDHLMYRSYYVAVKSVIDGDLCERFLSLSYNLKQVVAGELNREVVEIEKKIQEMRTRVAF